MNLLPHQVAAYEVMYAYINPEVSEAYPEFHLIKNIPIGVKYYFTRQACQEVCDKLNREHAKATAERCDPFLNR